MDLTDLRLETRERLGELTADFWTDVEVDRAINEALNRFCMEEKWPFLLTDYSNTLAAATTELDLPDDVSLNRMFNLAVSGGSLSYGRMLERLSSADGFRQQFNAQALTGPPRWYYIIRSSAIVVGAPPTVYTVKFIPTPDVDYDLSGQYMAVPTMLSGAQDEPVIPTEYQEAIPARAAGKLFLKENMAAISQKASEQFQLYFQVLAQARKDFKEFDLDETVAWGRSHPHGRRPGRGLMTNDPWNRIPPTLG